MKRLLVGAALLLAACSGGSPANDSPQTPLRNTLQASATAAPEPMFAPASAAAGIELPVVQADHLPLATLDPQAPWMALCVRHGAAMRARAGGDAAWQECPDEQSVTKLLDRHGEMDFDAGHSTLQIVLVVDGRAAWENVLAVLELLAGQRVRRVYALAGCNKGTCLLDLSLPVGESPPPGQVAALDISGSGEELRATLVLDGTTREFAGARTLAEIAAAAARASNAPALLRLRVPRTAPAALFFAALEAVAPSRFAAVSVAA